LGSRQVFLRLIDGFWGLLGVTHILLTTIMQVINVMNHSLLLIIVIKENLNKLIEFLRAPFYVPVLQDSLLLLNLPIKLRHHPQGVNHLIDVCVYLRVIQQFEGYQLVVLVHDTVDGYHAAFV
jgi:hypothetical protein